MGPINRVLSSTAASNIAISKNKLLGQSLSNFHTVIKLFAREPTFCRELIPGDPGFIGYCDASKLGAGGVSV